MDFGEAARNGASSFRVTVLSGRKKRRAYFSEFARLLKKSGNSAPKNGNTLSQP